MRRGSLQAKRVELTPNGAGFALTRSERAAPSAAAERHVAACTERWFNQTLCRVNDCVVRLGVFEGEFHWHKHDEEDEFFFVLEGRLVLLAAAPNDSLVSACAACPDVSWL